MKKVSPFPHATSIDKLARLDLSERLFLWGFRGMAQHRNCGCPIFAATRHVYGRFRIEDAVGPLGTLIEVFAGNAHTAVEIHSPNCPCLSESEILLLRAVAAAQSADLNMARRGFERWLQGLAADWALGPACEIAGIFRAAGMRFELRDIAAISTFESAVARNPTVGSRALH